MLTAGHFFVCGKEKNSPHVQKYKRGNEMII